MTDTIEVEEKTEPTPHLTCIDLGDGIELGAVERMPMPTAHQGVSFDESYKFFTPPYDRNVLANLVNINSYHGSIVEARANLIAKDYIENDHITFEEVLALSKDLVVFGECGFQVFANVFKQPLRLGHVPFQPMRKGKKNQFCRFDEEKSTVKWFKPAEIFHVKKYDTRQNIYGAPDYISGMESAMLSQDATRFRRRYYLNGNHAGFILYTTDPNLTPEVQEELEKALKGTRGVGNFKNMLINIPNGQEKGVQVLPIGNISTKDDFLDIKSVSEQGVMVSHRFHPGLNGVMPPEGTSLGDPEKYNLTYYENEVRPMQKLLSGVNRLFKKPVIEFENPFQRDVN